MERLEVSGAVRHIYASLGFIGIVSHLRTAVMYAVTATWQMCSRNYTLNIVI
jgi:hypothetical protein